MRHPARHQTSSVKRQASSVKRLREIPSLSVLPAQELLGVVALNAGKKIQYDAATLKIANAPEAEQFLRRQYRQGWNLS